MGKKRVIFSLILNIICVVTSLVYSAFALNYFGKMISLAIRGGEYDWMDFMALLIFILFPTAAALVLPIRSISLINITVAISKIRKGIFAKGNLIATGVLQMADVLISLCGIAGVIVWFIGFLLDDFIRGILGSNYSDYYWPVFGFIALFFAIPYIVAAVSHIASSIMLFTVKKNVCDGYPDKKKENPSVS